MSANFGITEQQRKLSIIGRHMMDLAVTEKDDTVSCRLSIVGNMLTEFGTAYGSREQDFTDADKQLISSCMANM